MFAYDLLSEPPRPLYILDVYVKINVTTFQNIHKRVTQALALSKEEMLTSHNKKSSNFQLANNDRLFSC